MRWPTIARCKQIAAETRGAEVAEFAAVLPILMMLLLGIISFARAYNVHTTITYAAQEGARTAAASSCATCGNTAATADDVAARVTEVLQASKIDPSAIQTYTGATTEISCAPGGGPASCSDSGNVHVCTNVELNATTRRRRGRTITSVTGPAACGATVSFEYPYQFNLPFTSISRQLVTLKADVQAPSED
jgi:Flp pilus assembly protein TadG